MDDELTPEEQDREHLRQNPAAECHLWMSWVVTVCGWKKISPPTAAEWDALKKKFHHGKMPVTSVDELEAMRAAASAS